MGLHMAARFTVLFPRLLALVVVWLLGWSTFTLAADTQAPQGAGTTAAQASSTEAPQFLVVPDVRKKAYVFAKGILQDAGFAWRTQGPVQGYAANVVVGQNPAPGTEVYDNGEPTVVLVLERNAKYGERGLPENESPYKGEKIVLASEYRKEQRKKKEQEQKQAEAAAAAATTTAPAPAPAAPTTPPATTTAPPQPATAPPQAETRKPDFVVHGAPLEPADEMPLPKRARRLAAYVAGHRPTDETVNHWLYQHNWIVTGALFGWQNGAEALRLLIEVDRDVQRRWEIGARSEAVARRALAEVERKLKR